MPGMPERRKVPRVVVPWHLSGRMRGGGEVRILDLSTAGVGIEHMEPLQPGASCALEFPLPFGAVHLEARVVWSSMKGDGQIQENERESRYHSGLAFTELTPEQQSALARTLETLQTTHGTSVQGIPR